MKLRHLVLAVCLVAVAPLAPIGCQNTSSQVVAVQTLKMIGETAESAVIVSGKLYQDGKITAAQAREVLDTFNNKFQPVFRLAVSGAKADLSNPASPDLIALAGQLTSLVLSYQK